MDQNLLQKAIEKPLFDPTFLNLDYFFNKFYVFLQRIGILHDIGSSGSLSSTTVDSTGHVVKTSVLHIGSTVYFVSYILSLFAITIIIYALVRMFEIQKDENGHLKHEIEEAMARELEEKGSRDPRFMHIERLMLSPSESDWRLAIIEADNLLEALLEEKGVVGSSISEKLKNIAPGDLGSIQAAWEAHLVRNKIAHEGLAYELSERDARKTIGLFELVFRELGLAI